MSKKPGYENTVVCPYNKCHVVLKGRFQIHMSKCAKQHPHVRLETCPYDVMHKFRAEEIAAHIKNCPSYENFLLKAAEEQAAQSQQLAPAPRITIYGKDCDEHAPQPQLLAPAPRITIYDKDYEEQAAQSQQLVPRITYYDEDCV